MNGPNDETKICFFVLFCFVFEREHTRVGEGQRETEGEKLLGRLHTQCGARCRAWSHDPGIVTSRNQESDAQLTEPFRHRLTYFLNFFKVCLFV